MNDFFKHFEQESIVAIGREKRPFVSADDVQCPFCPQNKESLEKIISEDYENGTLYARIVANKYPISSNEQANGIHDVIIDTEDHLERPKDFSIVHWEKLLIALWNRWLEIMAMQQMAFIQIFKNEGKAAGASISHSHWQLLALTSVPIKMLEQYKRYADDVCYLCQESNLDEGFHVFETIYWKVWVPPHPEFNGEVWLIPKRHIAHYGKLHIQEIKDLGKLMKMVLNAYEKMMPNAAYNICFMSGDLNEKWQYHFHIKIVMRIGNIAGFEIATGCHILTKAPRAYADELYINIKGMYK